MTHMRTRHVALLITALVIFGFTAGASAADQKIRVKVPGIT